MPTKQEQELVKLVEKNADILTPRTVTDFIWCAKHEEEILKMMGLLPCSTDELYQITNLFLSEGQTSLFAAIRYRSTYGKTKEEKAEEEKRIDEYIRRNLPKRKRPYDYDSVLQFQKDTFLTWCDDYDCAAFVRENQDDNLLRLTYLALAVGFSEFGVYLCALIKPERSTVYNLSQDNDGFEEMTDKWVQDFIDKQPEGSRKEELKKRIDINWPLLKESARECPE